MSYTLEQFAADCREALKNDPGAPGREAVRRCVQRACQDEAFVCTHLGPDNRADRQILYEDPELGFCILVHVNEGPKSSDPHDHGPSWAIYGQAKGVTEMTDWRKLSAPTADVPGTVEKVRTYHLEAGEAHIYHEGDLHSPHRAAETRLVRIEGMNLTNVARDAYEAVG